MDYARLPDAPACAGGVPVASVAEARDRGFGLVTGRRSGQLAVWEPVARAAPLSVDWLAGRQGYRLAADRVRHEKLVKALGKPEQQPAPVLDLTAGLGRDAALLAQAGFAVTIMERHPLLHALLADGLARLAASDSPLVARLSLLPSGDAVKLDLPAISWHALYLDPMFPARTKSAAVKRDLLWLQWLCPYPDAEEEAALLAFALRQRAKWVVVKRPRRAPSLAGVAPHHEISGKTVRFDVHAGGATAPDPGPAPG